MDTEELLNNLESNPELDCWFLPNNPDEENLEVFIKVDGKFFFWSEQDVLQKVSFTPAPKFD